MSLAMLTPKQTNLSDCCCCFLFLFFLGGGSDGHTDHGVSSRVPIQHLKRGGTGRKLTFPAPGFPVKARALRGFFFAKGRGEKQGRACAFPGFQEETRVCSAFFGSNRFGIPFWLVGEFTTHFRTYFSGWIESDVHWGLTGAFDPWPYCGWTKSISHHFETTGNRCLLVFLQGIRLTS